MRSPIHPRHVLKNWRRSRTEGSGCLCSNRSLFANSRFYYISSAVRYGVKERPKRKKLKTKVARHPPKPWYGSGQTAGFPAGSAGTAVGRRENRKRKRNFPARTVRRRAKVKRADPTFFGGFPKIGVDSGRFAQPFGLQDDFFRPGASSRARFHFFGVSSSEESVSFAVLESDVYTEPR